MIPRLAITLAITLTTLLITVSAIPSSQPEYPAHCECRCCTRSHFHTKCPDEPLIVPLTERYACDTRFPIYHNPNVCGPALCKAHFLDQCPPPAFMEHSCVSDRGAFHDWAPLAFVSLALILSAYAASMFAARIPAHMIKTAGKRSRATEPATEVCQPLVSASSLSASYGIEILDHSPRRANTAPVASPFSSLADLTQSNTFPLNCPRSSSPLQNVIIEPHHLSPSQPASQPVVSASQELQVEVIAAVECEDELKN